MRVLLNAGFGDPLGGADLDLIRGLGFAGVRQDVRSASAMPALVLDLVYSQLDALFVLGPEVWSDPAAVRRVALDAARVPSFARRAMFEVGNELDGMDSHSYAQHFAAAESAIRAVLPDAVVVTAGIKNMSPASLGWLSSVLRTGSVSPRAWVGYHPYRGGSPSEPLAGHRDRASEFALLRAIAGDRRVACTEIGWTNGRTSWWPCHRPLSEGQVAAYLREEIMRNRAAGAELLVVYQLNDGTDQRGLMGIRRRDGTLKPSAYVAREAS